MPKAERHRRSSFVFTANRSVEEWLGLFDDPILGNSALDRLAHGAHQGLVSPDGDMGFPGTLTATLREEVSVSCLAFHPDGKTLAAGRQDAVKIAGIMHCAPRLCAVTLTPGQVRPWGFVPAGAAGRGRSERWTASSGW